MNLLLRLTSAGLCLVLLTGHSAVCAGWAPTPEARMTCCVASGSCPMHRDSSGEDGTEQVLTQLQVDNCCASSERDGSNQPNTTSAGVIISNAVLGCSVTLPAIVPALVLRDNWRTIAPIPPRPVPKHVLLSVFLV